MNTNMIDLRNPNNIITIDICQSSEVNTIKKALGIVNNKIIYYKLYDIYDKEQKKQEKNKKYVIQDAFPYSILKKCILMEQALKEIALEISNSNYKFINLNGIQCYYLTEYLSILSADYIKESLKLQKKKKKKLQKESDLTDDENERLNYLTSTVADLDSINSKIRCTVGESNLKMLERFLKSKDLIDGLKMFQNQ